MICKMKDNEIIQRKSIKNYQFGNTIIKVIIPEMTVAQKRKALKNIYDTINDIASSCENKGIDTSNWFYTNEELEEMKDSPDYIFI